MTTIILTSTVNIHDNIEWVFQREPNSRIQSYLSSILRWLNETDFYIILVENSGYEFNELMNEKLKFKDRFEVIVFDEAKLEEARYLKNTGSKGRHEIFAINYVFNNNQKIHLSNFIIKVTARFYIPEFQDFLKNYDLNNYDCLVQNDRNRCEVVGSHYTNFANIFHVYINDDHIENVWKERTSQFNNILVCNVFQIDKTQRGGQEMYTTI